MGDCALSWPCALAAGACQNEGMCGRGDVSYDDQDVREAFAAVGDVEIHIDLSSPHHDVRPTERVPVARLAGTRLRLEPVVWGTRDTSSTSRAPLLLVRAESVEKGALASRERGLVLFSRFYEWHGPKGTKRKAFAARGPHAPILPLAALISSTSRRMVSSTSPAQSSPDLR